MAQQNRRIDGLMTEAGVADGHRLPSSPSLRTTVCTAGVPGS